MLYPARWKKITVDQSKVLKNWLFRFFGATRYNCSQSPSEYVSAMLQSLGLHIVQMIVVQKVIEDRYKTFLRTTSEYKAFSRDIILSSNMAASIAIEINIHFNMQASFYIIVHNSFSMNFSIRGSSAWWSRACTWCVWLPWISRSVCAIRRPCWRTAWRQWKVLYCEERGMHTWEMHDMGNSSISRLPCYWQHTVFSRHEWISHAIQQN